VRQSSPTQVRNNLESPQRQRALAQRAEQLGWPASQVLVIEEQRAHSGSSRDGRTAYHQLSELVVGQHVGLILAVGVSRWARDGVAWQLLLRDCMFDGVLLADECHLYDPKDSHDHVSLGIQGVLAEYELHKIREQTIACWWNKARNQKMFPAIPTGVILGEGKLEQHPHRRVRHSFERLFAKFNECSSVIELCRWYLEHNELLPFVAHGDDPQQVQWQPVTYKRLLGILKNPTYAGAYVIGRRETIQVRTEQGEIVSRRRCVDREQWTVIQREHFEGYITWQQYEQNMAKIAKNAWGEESAGVARRGTSLLSGLLRCARCGSSLHVHYHRSQPSYVCRGGARQRERGKLCLNFSGQTVESLFSEMVLEAVRPAAIAAAGEAATQSREQSQPDRQVLLDQLEQLEYEAERARRQYDRVDPEHRLVADELEHRWNEALQATRAQRVRLQEFDLQHPPTPWDESLQSWFSPNRLEEVWYAPSSSASLKKQIVELLVREVMVELSESGDEVQLWIHWQGGHHTLLSAPRRARRGVGQQSEAKQVISILRSVSDDSCIARTLNRHGIGMSNTKGGKLSNWTAKSVRQFRERHAIAPFDAAEKSRRGLLTSEEAGRQLSISAMSVHRLIGAGILPAEQSRPGLPCIILSRDLELPEVQNAAHQIQRNLPRPLTENPSQQKLF